MPISPSSLHTLLATIRATTRSALAFPRVTQTLAKPRYPLELLLGIIIVALRTRDIVRGLPTLA